MAELICAYGSSGSFKTSQLLFLAKYAYKKWKKLTRLASCDLGGWKPLEPAVEAGLIQAWGVSAIENPRSVLRKLSQGYWPEVVTPANGTPHLVLRDNRTFLRDKVGVFGMEGLTSISNIIMRDALNKQLVVAGDQKGERGAIKFEEKVQTFDLNGKELTTEEKYSFATQGNYADSQYACYDFISNLKSLPCPLAYTTALETRAEEEETGKTILGPRLIGKAMTAQVGSMVGDLIHMEDFFVDVPDPTHQLTPEEKQRGAKQRVRQETRVRAWFIRHPDTRTGILYPAKPRVASDKIPKLLEIYPGGYFVPTIDSGLDAYLEVIDGLQQSSASGLREWMQEQDRLREVAAKVGGTDAPKADPALVKATMTGSVK